MTLSYLIVQVFEDSNYLLPHVLSNATCSVQFSHGRYHCAHMCGLLFDFSHVFHILSFFFFSIYFQISQKRNFLTSLWVLCCHLKRAEQKVSLSGMFTNALCPPGGLDSAAVGWPLPTLQQALIFRHVSNAWSAAHTAGFSVLYFHWESCSPSSDYWDGFSRWCLFFLQGPGGGLGREMGERSHPSLPLSPLGWHFTFQLLMDTRNI